MNSPDFDAIWLEERIASFPEGVFLDFKIEPPILDEKGDEKFTFAKHLIAFGNIARSTGKECFIVFGVDDKTRHRKDLREFYNQADAKEWDESTRIQKKQMDGVEERIRKIAEDWIKPEIPKFSLKYGVSLDGTFLSYLVIYPTNVSEPFCLKKSHKSRSAGTVFVRKCSSSVPIVPSEVENLLPISESEYLSRSEWQRFFVYHRTGEFESAKNLSPIFLHKTKDGMDALQSVIDALKDGKRTILIKGAAGEGKTTLLRRVAYQLSKSIDLVDEVPRNDLGEGEEKIDEDTFMVENFKNEMSTFPTSLVPVYMSLKTTFTRKEELDDLLLKQINQRIVEKDFHHLDRLFARKDVSWVILLDGIDELRGREAGAALHGWLQRLPANIKVVLTSRPYASPDITSVVYELAPLQPKDIPYLIKGKVQASLISADDNSIDDVMSMVNSTLDFIQSRSEILEFICRHRAIDGLLKYVNGLQSSQVALVDSTKTLVKTQPITPPENNKGAIPIIGKSDQFQSDDYFDVIFPEKDEYPAGKTSHRLVEILSVVYSHLQLEEVERQREFTRESQKEADMAAFQLARTAWHSNWNENYLNAEKCASYINEQSLDWNQFAGFINYKKMPIYTYCCVLFQQFLTAKYGYESKREEMDSSMQNYRGFVGNSVSIIKELYDEFCEWRGQASLSFGH